MMNGSKMKKTLCILAGLLCLAACHQPEYIAPTALRQGLTSLTAIITSGAYADQEVGKLMVTDPEASRFEIPISYYYPEASNEETLIYMMSMKVQAELQPNWKISPKLGIMDLTEDNTFTLTDPFGKSREIVITGTRVKPSACKLLSFMVEDVKTSGVVYEDNDKILIPYLDDLSSVSVSGQVSPHAKLSKINGQAYKAGNKYNLNTGATVTVLASNGTDSKTYNVEQGIPTLMSQGLRTSSVTLLSNVDPETIVHLPNYNEKCFVSLAGIGSTMVVGLGEGRAPVLVDAFTGSRVGEMPLGGAVADCLTNDDAGHIIIANYANGGDAAETVNVYSGSSVNTAPTLLYSFLNPISFPIGHRVKAMGDVTGDGVIVFTSEGITGVSVSSEIVVLTIQGGAVTSVDVKDFAPVGLGWGAAPVNIATVAPASPTPFEDGWFVDYYEGATGNTDPSVEDEQADCYILHHIDKKNKDTWLELVGNWSLNPNCLDAKTFNGGRFLALFAVSHFPQWECKPRLHFYDATDPSGASLMFKNDGITIFQKGAINTEFGAAGDVALVPTVDGYRLFVYYYDHHAQAIGAYVADCFEI